MPRRAVDERADHRIAGQLGSDEQAAAGLCVGEQQELFTIADGSGAESGADAARTAAGVRNLDPAQHQLDLDEVPRAVAAAASTGREDTEHTSSATGSTVDRASGATADDAQRQAAAATRVATAAAWGHMGQAKPADPAVDGQGSLFT